MKAFLIYCLLFILLVYVVDLVLRAAIGDMFTDIFLWSIVGLSMVATAYGAWEKHND